MKAYEIVATNIKKVIEEKGAKQKTIACASGFNEKEFSNMLNGRKIIKADDVLPIAVALGVTPNDLLKYPDQPQAI